MQTNVPQQIRKSMGRLVDSSYRACGQGAVRFLASLSRLGKYGGDRRDAVQSMGSRSGHVPGRFRSPGDVRSEEPQPVLFRRVLVHGMVTGRTLTAGGVPGCGLRGPTPSAGMPPPVLVATGEGLNVHVRIFRLQLRVEGVEAMPCTYCGAYIPWTDGPWQRNYRPVARDLSHVQRFPGNIWCVLFWNGTHRVHWYCVDENNGQLWFLKCDDCNADEYNVLDLAREESLERHRERRARMDFEQRRSDRGGGGSSAPGHRLRRGASSS